MTGIAYVLLTLGYYATLAIGTVRDTVRDTLPSSRGEADAFISGMIYASLMALVCLVLVSWAVGRAL